MKSFPMFLTMTGRRVVIAGGGEEAARKARLILRTEARLVLLAPDLDPELRALVDAGRAEHRAGPISPADFAGAALVFVATGSPAADACLHALAKAAGTLVNVVDTPALCDAVTPSIVDRDPVVVAIGTEGTAPVLARQIKTQVEGMLDPRLGAFAALSGRLRDAVAARVPHANRRAFWRWAFDGPAMAAHCRGAEGEAAALLKAAVAAGRAPGEAQGGEIALVGAGPGAADLMTMRAVARLQEADVIYYDRLVDPAVLDLARRDATRVCVGKVVGACDWPQERISGLIVADARRGLRVVRLKSGDPGIFARAAEELAAARAAGIPVEVVPGVTAASAAAAALGRPLTARGETDAVVLTTGASQGSGAPPDWGRHAQPGTTLCFYMAAASAAEVRASLLARGLATVTPVEVCAAASTPRERCLATTLARLPEAMVDAGIRDQAVIVVTVPRPQVDAVRRAS